MPLRMPFGRRRVRRLVAILALGLVNLTSVGPSAASLIYCIGDDGHSGFEFVRAGERGCASCCHEPASPAADSREEGVHTSATPVSECTDVALASETALSGKSPECSFVVSLVATVSPALLRFSSGDVDVSGPAPRVASERVLLGPVVLLL